MSTPRSNALGSSGGSSGVLGAATLRRRIGVVTVGRSDYGILQPVLAEIARRPGLLLDVHVGGMHLSRRHGMTISMVEADGHRIASRVDFALDESEDPVAVGEAIGRGVAGFARAFAAARPDLLLLLGDRYEMHAAALAALPQGIPLAHIHGGEVTEGAMDEALRHGITKMSHLHFPSTESHGRRILQLGEEAWRVTVTGAPALDRIASFNPSSREQLAARFGVPRDGPFLLATFHPVTLLADRTADDVAAMLGAIADAGMPAVFTLPNADTRGRLIRDMIERFVSEDSRHAIVGNFGADGYFSAMHHASAMIGNSSSGLLEAPSFRLPVVNIGERQQGRLRAANVVDVPANRTVIATALARVLDPCFRESLSGLVNPYGDGHASERIAARLSEVRIDAMLMMKRFCDRHPNTG